MNEGLYTTQWTVKRGPGLKRTTWVLTSEFGRSARWFLPEIEQRRLHESVLNLSRRAI